MLIAGEIAKNLGVPLFSNAVEKTTATPQMKNVPLHEREPLLSEAIQQGIDSVQNRRILLIDDLWETGSTLRRVGEVLSKMGASEIRAIAMTRTK
jgi:competence protein ComFC